MLTSMRLPCLATGKFPTVLGLKSYFLDVPDMLGCMAIVDDGEVCFQLCHECSPPAHVPQVRTRLPPPPSPWPCLASPAQCMQRVCQAAHSSVSSAGCCLLLYTVPMPRCLHQTSHCSQGACFINPPTSHDTLPYVRVDHNTSSEPAYCVC